MDRDEVCEKFIDAVPFDLYPFQEEAVLGWFEASDGLLVTAPTGMGKTLVAEASVFEALVTRQRLYYTTPLIALTDQKFTELQDKAEAWGFARDDVGLLTGSRKVNPDARVLVVVAEILLNHLLSPTDSFDDVTAVVMDEFHYFNDRERGVVWELSLVMLPEHVRLMLLSATVGNAVDFVLWLRDKHRRTLTLVNTGERRVPLEFAWVADKLLTEHLVEMVADDDAESRAPALVFCFSRDECWEVAERLKGLPLISKETRAAIESVMEEEGEPLDQGIGTKLRQMLIRGVGVHHAGVLPRYKSLVETLFLRKLIPFVVCTETLAAGVNLPARSVVLRTLLKGKPRERKLLPSSAAHQMFGRAGRPQFDDRGHVFALAHEDDVKIHRWQEKYDQIPAKTADPNLLRARKQLERKRPKRRKTEQYWSEGQFRQLIEAGPAKLSSRSMIPYRFLVYLLTHHPDVGRVRAFLGRRFNSQQRLAGFEKQLDAMIGNLAALGYLTREDDSDDVELDDSIATLLEFRSIDPLYGRWLTQQLVPASFEEKLLALESVLQLPWNVARRVDLPLDWAPGPLQTHVLEPRLVGMGIVVAKPESEEPKERLPMWEEDEEEQPPDFAEMLKIAFESELATPEDLFVQLKWVAGGIRDTQGDFRRFVRSRDLSKNEGLVLRHLLRLVMLAEEFVAHTEDPQYEEIARLAREASEAVDPRYTERFLANETDRPDLLRV